MDQNIPIPIRNSEPGINHFISLDIQVMIQQYQLVTTNGTVSSSLVLYNQSSHGLARERRRYTGGTWKCIYTRTWGMGGNGKGYRRVGSQQ